MQKSAHMFSQNVYVIKGMYGLLNASYNVFVNHLLRLK